MEERLDNPGIRDDESVDSDIKIEEELTLCLYISNFIMGGFNGRILK